ncbi:ATP-dependent DNA helicase RecG [Pseudohalioglobus lutimaris]|uniref:ATP-dependent DNA helicase RecG n=1 Tax=Pseudohalioglobus lutimaris TaxID=1737061 RepID=A0A2N5X8X0_9GAMM|nr:ATP-dependent DNA helicase RecG [Pseudohalioglobus lutimaris]PLW70940.1 ATP-dependent DNA helicase RecG [Pseudohalioglobus lutimaris]
MTGIASEPVTQLRGVGPKLATKLAEAGVYRVEDLLFHLPLRYQDRTRVTPIGGAADGADVVIEGEVRVADIAFGRRRSLVVRLQDGTGTISLRFFHFSAAQKNNLLPGTRLRCFGQVRRGASGLEMYHPEYRQIEDGESPVEEALTPVYPTINGIGQNQWRNLCTQAVTRLRRSAPAELLPSSHRLRYGLAEALVYLHAPPPDAPQEALRDGEHPAQLRLALEELVAHNLTLQGLRNEQLREGAPRLNIGNDLVQRFFASLPFEPTGAQHRVMAEICTDLAKPHPMLRLVQGDVGSGKTLVAAAAALQAIASGYQVAIMAPTEILAEQHRANFQSWFEGLDIEVGWLSGRSKGKKRAEALQHIASGRVGLVVGTHALFQEDVIFQRLGLVVVDEQHRFGVHQRLSLTEKAAAGVGRPHQLVMTATPIPRTLSMVAYADLDCSVIDELPPGRQPVETVLIDNNRREQIVSRVAGACSGGRQAYWVCTLVEESDVLQAQAAEATAEELRVALPHLRIGLVHGRLKPAEKDAVMAAFKAADLDLLVATTVIEVGVDVPNASLMIIENPERLGLAQLHQLRGRVGRGREASHCVLLYQAPLSANGRERLTAMRESNDGFYIAEKDLQLRGPGEVLGTRQTGLMEFRVARLPEHNELLDDVQLLAAQIQSEYPQMAEPLIQRWTGSAREFAKV